MNDRALRQQSKALQVVGVASGCGAPDAGCEAGADALRAMRITERLRARGFSARWADVIRPATAYRADTLKAVRRICTRLARRVERIVREGDLPIVMGGDHTIAIGTWKGVAHARREAGLLGLLWIDAHMDAHTPQTTESGMLHGMPVACLLGHGYPELTRIAEGARLDPGCVCLYGVRSFERGEAEFLERVGVRVFFMEEIARRGIPDTLGEALAIVGCAGAGFGITLDMDAIDPLDAPGVGSPAPDGMRGRDLVAALAAHGAHPNLVGVEIVEYNPYLDRNAATAVLVADALDAILTGQFNSSGDVQMLVRFDSKVGMLQMFGDVAKTLLRLMGQSGAVPGAILARDIPAAVERLKRGVGAAPRTEGDSSDEAEPQVQLSQRAFPLIELLERAAKSDADVVWEEERKAV